MYIATLSPDALKLVTSSMEPVENPQQNLIFMRFNNAGAANKKLRKTGSFDMNPEQTSIDDYSWTNGSKFFHRFNP